MTKLGLISIFAVAAGAAACGGKIAGTVEVDPPVPIYGGGTQPPSDTPPPGDEPGQKQGSQGSGTTQPAGSSMFNIAFGGARPSTKSGAAAIGAEGDFWNAVVVPFDSDHTELGLLNVDHYRSPIQVRLLNLGGSWGQAGKLALHDAMIENFDYPVNNQGGDSHVTLSHVPNGLFTLYVYGTSANPDYYGDYSVSSGGVEYGRKKTQSGPEAAAATKWTEGLHYVTFRSVDVKDGVIEILIRPGGLVSDSPGRYFRDAYICGLQLAPQY